VGNFTATLDLPTATVVGQAPANAHLLVQPVKWMGEYYYGAWWEHCEMPTADATGHYSVNGASWGLADGDYVSVRMAQGGDVWEVDARSTWPVQQDVALAGALTPGTPVTIRWQVVGARHVQSGSLAWSTTSHRADGAYENSVVAQTTDGVHCQATFDLPDDATGSLYFRTYAYADGRLLESPEQTAAIAALYSAYLYLPLVRR
jgi:hypothetical protein